jgi:hypothetical protein
MFSTTLALVSFIVTTGILVLLIADSIVNKKYNSLMQYVNPTTYWNTRMYILVAVWVASGFYIWG